MTSLLQTAGIEILINLRKRGRSNAKEICARQLRRRCAKLDNYKSLDYDSQVLPDLMQQSHNTDGNWKSTLTHKYSNGIN